jgi:hypothetical protein
MLQPNLAGWTRAPCRRRNGRAFLENAIIGIDTVSITEGLDRAESIISSPLLREVGARIRHLNLNLFIRTYETTLYSYLRFPEGAVHCMNTLKARCPNLRTCILTAGVVRFGYVDGPPRGPFPPPLAMFEP